MSALGLLRRSLPGGQAVPRLLAVSAAEALPALLVGVCLAHAVDGFRAGHVGHAVLWLGVLAAAVVTSAGATSALYGAAAQVVEGVRDALLSAVVRGSVHRMAATGRAASAGSVPVTQAVDQVDQVRNLLSAQLRSLRTTVTPLVAAAIGLAALDWRLGLAVLTPLVLALLAYAALLPGTVARHRASAVADERFGATATELTSELRTVQGLGVEQWAGRRLADAAGAVGTAESRVARAIAARHAVIAVGSYLPLLAVFVIGAPLVGRGELSLGAVVGACTYVLTVLAPALSATVSGAGSWMVQLTVLLDRLAKVAEEPEPSLVRPGSAETSAAVDARKLAFSYRPSARPVVEGLELTVASGELVAVVGPSGAGKSTLGHLIAGLLSPTAGTVGAGADHRIALLPQDPFVLTGTLRENLTYLGGDSDDAELHVCVRELGLRQLCLRLGGLSGEVRPDELTAAERQRLALARAYLTGADVLVLDEALSGCTPAEEQRIEEWLRAQGRTVISISHRLDIVTRADQVVYFDGHSVSVGEHGRLLQANADYADLVLFALA